MSAGLYTVGRKASRLGPREKGLATWDGKKGERRPPGREAEALVELLGQGMEV